MSRMWPSHWGWERGPGAELRQLQRTSGWSVRERAGSWQESGGLAWSGPGRRVWRSLLGKARGPRATELREWSTRKPSSTRSQKSGGRGSDTLKTKALPYWGDFAFTLQNTPIFCLAQNLQLIRINFHLKLLAEFYSWLKMKLLFNCLMKKMSHFSSWKNRLSMPIKFPQIFSKYLIKPELYWVVWVRSSWLNYPHLKKIQSALLMQIRISCR